jgi:hypothetical protein
MAQLRLRSVTFLLALPSLALAAACSSSSSPTTSSDAGAKDTAPPFDAGGPITGLPTEKWTWVPFPESKCRDGSSTGIGVNYNPASTKVMFYLEGGGACFNSATCILNQNPFNFTEVDFEALASSTADGSLNAGMLDRTKSANPVQDWTYVYIPYCTGDVHAGDNVAPVSGVSVGTPQDFAGYTNMKQYLARVVPTFPKATQVLFAGMSAGGFGAAADYDLAATAFGSIPVFMLDDSGPFMENPYFATCLVNLASTLWGLDKTVFATCGSNCTTPGSQFVEYAKYITTKYPNVTFGLADSLDDGTITEFFGFGADNCNQAGFQQLTATQFTDGLLDIRSKLSGSPNFGTFYFPGAEHTSTQSSIFYTRTSNTPDGGTDGPDGGGVLMTDWVASLLAGHATNVGP